MRFVTTILSAAFCLCLASSQVAAQPAIQPADQTTEQSDSADSQSDVQQDEIDEATDSEAAKSQQSPSTQATLTASPPTDSADVETPNKTFELTFDDLKFEMEKGDKFDRSLLTEKINSYDNNTISVRGYIRPAFSQSGLKKFIFVRDNKECCFGPGAALYDCILVRLAKGNTTDFTVRPITIEGTFTLKEYMGPDGKVWSIYRMNGADVK